MTYIKTVHALLIPLLAVITLHPRISLAGGSDEKSQIYVMNPHDGDEIEIQPMRLEVRTLKKTGVVTSVQISFVLDATKNKRHTDVILMGIHGVLDRQKVSDTLIIAAHQEWIRLNRMTRPFNTVYFRDFENGDDAIDTIHILPLSVTFGKECSETISDGCFSRSFPDGKRVTEIKGVLAVYQVPRSDRPDEYHFALADIQTDALPVGDNLKFSPAIKIRDGDFQKTFYEMRPEAGYPF